MSRLCFLCARSSSVGVSPFLSFPCAQTTVLFRIYSRALSPCVPGPPLRLESLRRHSVLRSHLTCLNLLSVRDGVAVGADGTPRPRSLVVSLIYRAPVPDEGAWVAAATEEARRITGGGTDGEGSGGGRGGSSGGDSGDGGSGVSFICQARGQRLAAGGGDCSVLETYRLRDGRRLTYRHVFGHFSNPNAFACEHTLDFLSAAVTDGLPAAERRGEFTSQLPKTT